MKMDLADIHGESVDAGAVDECARFVGVGEAQIGSGGAEADVATNPSEGIELCFDRGTARMRALSNSTDSCYAVAGRNAAGSLASL